MGHGPAVRILYGEADARIASAQSALLAGPGHHVEQAIGRRAIEEALLGGRFDLLVLGHTLTKDDRHHLPYRAKRADAGIRVLVLHASGKHPKVDLAIDSRRGEAAVRQAINDLLLQFAAAS